MRKLILGTDWWTDCDDAVALRLLANADKKGEIKLIGIGINAAMEHSVASLRGFLKAEGMTDIPVGIDLSATNFGGVPKYQKRLAENFGKEFTNADAEDAVRLYRRLLASAEEKIEIIEIGFLQVVSALLLSTGDDISEKSGLELVSEKVAKFWVMAGKWDGDGEREHNFCLNERTRRAARIFCELCPVPVTFLGWEIGYGVITGGSLPEEDHLKTTLNDHGSNNGRHSWDPMTALMAIIGDEEKAGYGTTRGYATVDEADGANHFKEDANGTHAYVTMRLPKEYYANEINSLIGFIPKG
jgi:hypothetical protein